jgi:hypothetical protein
VLNELESQNDGQVEGIMGKVRQLKDVCVPWMKKGVVLMEADDSSDWGRDSREFSAGGEDE